MHTFSRYWHTVRFLKPRQIYSRIFFKAFKPQVDLSPPPGLRTLDAGRWTLPPKRKSSMVSEDEFLFLNQTYKLTKTGWDNPKIPKLWRYNLHYFDDLNAEEAQQREQWHQAIISDWIKANPPGIGIGWEPYPVSLRIVNWIKWALAGNNLSQEAVHSLAIQTRWLANRLEFHLLGNHLITNAKALIFSGLFFEGKEASIWLSKGIAILKRQLSDQILPDGGHCELSTMYQAIVLGDILDLYNFLSACLLVSASLLSQLKSLASQMLTWLFAMSHPDGEISFFNDAAKGIASTPVQIREYAQRLGINFIENRDELIHLKDSGYIRIGDGDVAIFLDVAFVGPDYLPGHAHADTLSFELSSNGSRVFVNSGTSCYESGPERLYQRGTAAHNTVLVNGENSSEVWDSFRVARRAKPFGLMVKRRGSTIDIKCAHDGYKRLPGKPIHWRQWQFVRHALIITDFISGNFREAEVRFHLHPSVEIESIDRDRGILSLAIEKTKMKMSVQEGAIDIHTGFWHPEFGRNEPNKCISVKFISSRVETTIYWNK